MIQQESSSSEERLDECWQWMYSQHQVNLCHHQTSRIQYNLMGWILWICITGLWSRTVVALVLRIFCFSHPPDPGLISDLPPSWGVLIRSFQLPKFDLIKERFEWIPTEGCSGKELMWPNSPLRLGSIRVNLWLMPIARAMIHLIEHATTGSAIPSIRLIRGMRKAGRFPNRYLETLNNVELNWKLARWQAAILWKLTFSNYWETVPICATCLSGTNLGNANWDFR